MSSAVPKLQINPTAPSNYVTPLKAAHAASRQKFHDRTRLLGATVEEEWEIALKDVHCRIRLFLCADKTRKLSVSMVNHPSTNVTPLFIRQIGHDRIRNGGRPHYEKHFPALSDAQANTLKHAIVEITQQPNHTPYALLECIKMACAIETGIYR